MKKWLILPLLFLALQINAQALIIDFNQYTKDTSTNLDWLDFNNTLNRSFNDVFSQLASGGAFDGWRYADDKEVKELWEDFGIQYIDQAPSEQNVTPVEGFMDFFGITGQSGGLPISRGRTADGFSSVNGPEHYVADVGLINSGFYDPSVGRIVNNTLGGYADLRNSDIVDNSKGLNSGIASYLVRDAQLDSSVVPEPQTIGLLALGLVLLSWKALIVKSKGLSY